MMSTELDCMQYFTLSGMHFTSMYLQDYMQRFEVSEKNIKMFLFCSATYWFVVVGVLLCKKQ